MTIQNAAIGGIRYEVDTEYHAKGKRRYYTPTGVVQLVLFYRLSQTIKRKDADRIASSRVVLDKISQLWFGLTGEEKEQVILLRLSATGDVAIYDKPLGPGPQSTLDALADSGVIMFIDIYQIISDVQSKLTNCAGVDVLP